MKLSSFPYLVQKEIIDHFSINQLFFFSLCSKNTKNFIKESQKQQLKNVEQVIYTINGTSMYIRVKMVNESYGSRVMGFYKSKEDFRRNDLVQEVRVNELATPIDFLRCLTRNPNLHAKYSPDTLESIIESVHNQLYDLLGNDTKFWLESFVHSVAEGNLFLPLLKNIQKLYVIGKVSASTRIEEFLDRPTRLEQFTWSTMSNTPIQLRENSKLYDLDSVYVSTTGCSPCPMANDVLKRFNGRHAFLQSSEFDTPDVIQFLNEWKSGDNFKNLELISVDWRFNLQEIRNAVETKEVDREVKYSFVRRFEKENGDFPHLDSGEFKSHYYMVRESDGRVASVMLTERLIMMGVWNMTEKEFLNKFN